MVRSASAWGLVVGLVGGAAAASGSPADFVGAKACQPCHGAIYARWLGSPHGRAAADLSASERASRRCLACHGTGEAPAGPARLGVGCEACHGAGAAYRDDDVMRDPALASALGLVALATPSARAAVCGRCHQGATRLTGFDAEAAWRSLSH